MKMAARRPMTITVGITDPYRSLAIDPPRSRDARLGADLMMRSCHVQPLRVRDRYRRL
jgi:hypothetical protein